MHASNERHGNRGRNRPNAPPGRVEGDRRSSRRLGAHCPELGNRAGTAGSENGEEPPREGRRLRSGAGCLASGHRAALPHAVPGERELGESELVLVDWGAAAGLYKSDLTRVLVTGRISPKFKRLYEIVLEAQTRAIAAIRPGVAAQDVDQVARRVIDEAGHGRRFGHGLGHGIGLDVHEAPRLAAESTAVLKPGMVVTVEPGIYLPGWGGIRIEDDVLVTRDGHEVLTHVGKQLSEVIVP